MLNKTNIIPLRPTNPDKFSLDIYSVNGGMVSIDACVPMHVALQILNLIQLDAPRHVTRRANIIPIIPT